MAIIIFLCGGKNKRAPLGCSLLSYLDSNQDKLIQSQMCYRYTIGQSPFYRASVSPKAGAKVQTFSELAKYFFYFPVSGRLFLLSSNVLFGQYFCAPKSFRPASGRCRRCLFAVIWPLSERCSDGAKRRRCTVAVTGCRRPRSSLPWRSFQAQVCRSGG